MEITFYSLKAELSVWFKWHSFIQHQVFSDSSSIILWHELEDMNKKVYLQNFSWFQFYVSKLCMIYMCFIAPIDYCIKLSLVYETFCKICSHFILKWFQPNASEEMCFSEESYEMTQKIQILRVPSICNQGVCL